MNKRSVFVPFLLLAVVFFVFLVRRWNEPVRKEAFDRTRSSLTYSKHALCRMDCRHISKQEVEEIIARGIINFNKSNRRANPCPIFALQGRTSGGEKIRVIVTQCPSETRVITCYNMEEDFYCDCPGDAKKEVR